MMQWKMEIKRDTSEREGHVGINGQKNYSRDIFLRTIYSENFASMNTYSQQD